MKFSTLVCACPGYTHFMFDSKDKRIYNFSMVSFFCNGLQGVISSVFSLIISLSNINLLVLTVNERKDSWMIGGFRAAE